MMLPPPPVTGADVGTGVAVGIAVTVAGDDAVTVTVADDVTVTVGDGVNVTVGDGDGVNVTVGVGDGLWVPDSVVACVAVPVSAITAAPMTRQPDACSPDRSITVISVTDRSLVINESASLMSPGLSPVNRIYRLVARGSD
jgi:hypothetical protein